MPRLTALPRPQRHCTNAARSAPSKLAAFAAWRSWRFTFLKTTREETPGAQRRQGAIFVLHATLDRPAKTATTTAPTLLEAHPQNLPPLPLCRPVALPFRTRRQEREK